LKRPFTRCRIQKKRPAKKKRRGEETSGIAAILDSRRGAQDLKEARKGTREGNLQSAASIEQKVEKRRGGQRDPKPCNC